MGVGRQCFRPQGLIVGSFLCCQGGPPEEEESFVSVSNASSLSEMVAAMQIQQSEQAVVSACSDAGGGEGRGDARAEALADISGRR